MKLRIRDNLESAYQDIFSPHVIDNLASMSRFNENQKNLMPKRIQRRSQRAADMEKISFPSKPKAKLCDENSMPLYVKYHSTFQLFC